MATVGAYKGVNIASGLSDATVQSLMASIDKSQKEPAALSSSSGTKNFATNVQPTIDAATAAHATAQETKNTNKKNKEKSQNDLPPDVQNEMDAESDPVKKAQDALFKMWDREKTETQKTAQELTLAATQSAKASIANLTGQWEERRKLLEENNRRSEASWSQQFTRFGQAEYSPGMTGQFLSEKEREGMNLLSDLDSQYNSAISQVNASLAEKKYSIAADRTRALKAIEEKALNQILANAKEAQAVNDKLREKVIQSSRENAIAGLVKQGITDPSDIQGILAESAQASGYSSGDFTLDEISKTLKILGHDPSMSGLSADYRTYQELKNTGQIGEDWSYFDFQSAVTNSKRVSKGTGSGSGGGTGGSSTSIPAYDEFVSSFLQTPEGAQMAAALEEERKQNLPYETLIRELEPQLRPIYDQVSGELQSQVEETGSDWDKARVIIDKAPTQEWYTLRAQLLEDTDLSSTEIDTVLRSKGLSPTKAGSGGTDLSTEDFMAELKKAAGQ